MPCRPPLPPVILSPDLRILHYLWPPISAFSSPCAIGLLNICLLIGLIAPVSYVSLFASPWWLLPNTFDDLNAMGLRLNHYCRVDSEQAAFLPSL
jgi:hypothetical protein